MYSCTNEVRKHNTLDVQSIVSKPDRKNISEYIKIAAEKEKKIIAKTVEEYATLSFDGGVFCGKSYFLGCLSFPYKTKKPILVCFKEGIKNQQQMAETCAEIISNFYCSVKITNVVTDGLLYQVEAMNMASLTTKNFQKYLNINVKILYFYPSRWRKKFGTGDKNFFIYDVSRKV
jgi:hypothetical protein